MNKLQMLTSEGWEYVFCHNPRGWVVTTKDRSKALTGKAMGYFQYKHGNREFRIEGEK